jgi:hypothetical protein
MGKLLFGTEETVNCIRHVEVKGANNESLCLGYKTTKTFFGAGVRFTDDGYVLGVEAGSKITSYIKLTSPEIERLQSASLLPRPLPAYSVPWYEYAFGYSLWIVLLLTVILHRVAAMAKARRVQARGAEAAATPVSYGPPIIETKADRFIQDQVAPLLEAGETVQQQAYTRDRAPDGSAISAAETTARFVALTDRRLFLIDARVGAFGILLENRRTEVLARSRITSLAVDDRVIHLTVDDGTVRTLWVDPTRKLSNQHRFLLDVPRILAVAPAAAVG